MNGVTCLICYADQIEYWCLCLTVAQSLCQQEILKCMISKTNIEDKTELKLKKLKKYQQFFI